MRPSTEEEEQENNYLEPIKHEPDHEYSEIDEDQPNQPNQEDPIYM